MRVKINFSEQSPLASIKIPIRIGDINYGGHVGNDAILSIIHEARMQWLSSCGYTELVIGDHGIIMADVMIAYKNESYYGEMLQVDIFAEATGSRSLDLLYHIQTYRDGTLIPIADAKTGMVCFNYESRKIVPIGKTLNGLLFRTTD